MNLTKEIPLIQRTNFIGYFFLLGVLSFTFLLSCKSKRTLSEESPAFTVIETAKSYRGTPYRYGGTTRAGMDCSALVYHSFFAVGITLPRKSQDQSKFGERIHLHQIKPGDVLFFATGRKKNEVTHSGIVTESDGEEIRFIHASTSLGVSEDYLHNPYWSKAFLYAKRILD